MTDIALVGICDQLSDEGLELLGACAEDGGAVPDVVVAELTDVATELLAVLLGDEYGRLRVMDAVELERHARKGGDD